MLAAAGGTLGSLFLIWAGEASFRTAVPWLLLAATISFATGPWIKRKLERHYQFNAKNWQWLSFVLEFIVYAYGGYFGLGMGIFLLALYAMFGHEDIHGVFLHNQFDMMCASLDDAATIRTFFVGFMSGCRESGE